MADIMNATRTDQHITLTDGRKLGFAEYGIADGLPLMLFHGTPGSRCMSFLERAEWVQRLGFRVLVPERPGFGLSDPAPRRSIGDWADDVIQLADHLGLGTFHVAGGSGGGPYALSCALHLPTRVRSATLICSGCPPQTMHDKGGMSRGNRLVFSLARYVPPLLRILMALFSRAVRKQGKPKSEKAKQRMLAQLCPWDRRVLEALGDDPDAKLQLTEAFRQGSAGAYHDIMRISHAWGLNLNSLEVPVFLWHGTADTLMPVAPARAFARRIPGCEAHFIEDAGHMLLADPETATRMMERIAAVWKQDNTRSSAHC
ncbi:MAG: alpha/beta hydrolase [Xanthomonadaceae bacterium]|nr:alpha/beta hydrolase [Xanthomonadaceae bacterium]MDE1964739.1 alpha/beta hydrolase [Xanthomonadaceae bacterium]